MCLMNATPAFASGHFKERFSPREKKSGSGAWDRRLCKLVCGAVSRAPPVVLPYRRRQRHSRRAASVRARTSGLITQSRYRSATDPAPSPPRSSGS